MFTVVINWMWIALSVFCVGYAVMHLFNRIVGYNRKDVDIVLMLGICFLTVYAQLFSLIYKVGAAASTILLCIDLALIIFLRKSLYQYVKKVLKTIWEEKWVFVLLLGLSCILVILTSRDIAHYDTYLYHAQSIRWIEEYGIVPGLGNLHNRMAYNSSVFCLQALFSLRFLLNQSLHSVNGFVTLIFLGYALCSMKFLRKEKFYTSDFLRLGLIIFFNDSQNYKVISSAGSDLVAMGIVLYILIKWVSLWEEGETQEAPYAYLCLLGAFGVSVKLSAAMIVLLTLLPAVNLIRKKKWKDICLYIFMGLIITLPYLIRNVIISGYLLYPYPELDLFDVDWKMPAYTLLFDRNEIKVWGWGLNNVRLFDTPFMEWFRVWYGNMGRVMKLMFILNIISTVVALFYGIYNVRKKDGRYLWIVFTICACFLLWFIGAPLSRYGSVYLTVMPLLVIGYAMSKLEINQDAGLTVVIFMMAFVSYHMHPIINQGLNCEWDHLKKSADYTKCECVEYKLGDEVIYVPADSDLTGYYAFPSTPYGERLNIIELRGEDISEGFKTKEDYRKAFVTPYGYIEDVNMFSDF